MPGKRIAATVRSADQRELWDIGENEYGDPMIFHLHPAGQAPAYVISRFDGALLAQCSECLAYIEVRGTDSLPLTT